MSTEHPSSESNLLPLIVEPEQLQSHLDQPALLIIDVPVNPDNYRQGMCRAQYIWIFAT